MTDEVNNDLETQMCEYFIDLNKRLTSLNNEISATFDVFFDKIEDNKSDKNKNYDQYKELMCSILDDSDGYYFENINNAKDFGIHHLSHNQLDPKCFYCDNPLKMMDLLKGLLMFGMVIIFIICRIFNF